MPDPGWLEPPPATSTEAPDGFAAELRGFGPVGWLAIATILLLAHVVVGDLLGLPIGALLALAWARGSHTSWRAIGYVRPRRPIATVLLGLAIGVALKLVSKAVVLPWIGAPPVNAAYHFLAGNPAVLPLATYGMLEAAFSEETVFRGFAFERLRTLLGTGALARGITLAVTSVLFGLGHLANQGWAGVAQATLTGLVFGSLYLASGSLLLPMVAHAAFDLAAVALIEAGLETRVAHLLFH